jgi:hypothetical protein
MAGHTPLREPTWYTERLVSVCGSCIMESSILCVNPAGHPVHHGGVVFFVRFRAKRRNRVFGAQEYPQKKFFRTCPSSSSGPAEGGSPRSARMIRAKKRLEPRFRGHNLPI